VTSSVVSHLTLVCRRLQPHCPPNLARLCGQA
jgi:hypothetical protein